MNDLIINVEKSTRMVLMTKTTVGNDMENLQEKLIFKFTDTFVDGQARLEYKTGSTKNYIELTKENNTYILPIQNVLTKEGKIEMQLVITEGESEENVSVFKSNVFYLYCNRSLNAVNEAPEGYDLWIEQANAKLNAMDEALEEVENLDIDASKSGDTATISITNKEGTTKTVQVKDGIDGQQGETGPANTLSIGTVTKGENASATITGESPNQTLNLVLPKGDKGDRGSTGATGNDGYSPSASVTQLSGGATITITDKTGTTTATITSGEQGPTGPTGPAGKDGKDGKDGTNGVDGTNATINGVSTLTIEAGTNISLDQQGSTLTINATGGSGGTSDYTQLTNKPKINNVELNGNKSLNDLGIQPIGNYLTEETDPTVPSYVKNITQANITSWNNKSDFSGNYNDLTNKPTIPVVPTNVSAFTNDVGYLTQHQDISGKANKISVVQSSASTIEINSNTFYKFGEVASLTITLASITDNTIYNEYMFEFVSGSTATTLTLPSSIKWLETPTIDANKIYQCSIVDNIGLLVGVTNV